MVKEFNLREMLDRIRSGDERAVHEMYVKYRKKFVAVLWKKFGKTFDIGTIINEYQECITILYERIVTEPEFEVRSSIGAYLIRIGERRLSAQYRYEVDQVSLPDEAEPVPASWQSDDAAMPEATTDWVSLVYQVIDEQLPELSGEILEMFYLERMSYAQICAELAPKYPDVALNPTAIRARKSRAIKLIRSLLADRQPTYQDG